MRLLFLLLMAMLPGLASDLAITNAKVYTSPSEAPIEHGTVIIHDGHISAVSLAAKLPIPAGATVIDGTGMTVTAGFWNSHVHVLIPELLNAAGKSAEDLNPQLEKMFTHWGFTTVFDIASVLANTENIRQRIERGVLKGPKILTVGEPFYPKGGVPVYVKDFLAKYQIHLPDDATVADAVARVDRQIAAGADGVKIFAGSIQAEGVMVMPLEQAKAIVTEAHRLNKPVFSHPSNTAGAEVSIRSGVDILAHVDTVGEAWNNALVDQIRAAHMAVIPTLTLFDVEGKKLGFPAETVERFINKGVSELRLYASSGGVVLFGTDIGYIDHFDTTEEFTLMTRAGMDWQQILASLTTNPTARFHADGHSGRVAKGFDGDLVILDGDPAADPTAFSKVHYTIRNGAVAYQRH